MFPKKDMKHFNLVKVLLVASALCILPANGQGNYMGCLKTIICNMGPFINQCCSSSFENGTLGKQEMVNCLYGVLMEKVQGCISGQSPGTGGEGEVEGERYGIGKQNERLPFAYKGVRSSGSSVWGHRKSNPISNEPYRSGNMFGNYGGSDIMKSENCQYIKSNKPNATEDCSAWSEAASNCIKEIPLMKSICQGGSSMFGQNPFSGMGNGGGGFGGMGGSSFGSNSPFGRGTRFNSFGSPGYVGVIGKPGRRNTPNPDDGREYEVIPASSRRMHFGSE